MSKSYISRRQFLRLLAGVSTGAALSACTPSGTAKPEPAKQETSNTPQTAVPSATSQASPTTAALPRAYPTLQTDVNILAKGLNFPETPCFDAQGNLWCTELNSGNLVKWSETGIQRFPTGGVPNGMLFDKNNLAWVADSKQNKIRRFDPATAIWEDIASSVDGSPLAGPNDLVFDTKGNLIFTCSGDWEGTSYVCCLKPGGATAKIAEGFHFPNGLNFIEDGRTLVVAETRRNRLWKGTWDAQTCTWKDAQPWVAISQQEGPDGMATGVDGLLYVALYGSAQVKAVNPTGEIIYIVPLPGNNPTCVGFDPSGRLGLIVTEAEHGQLLSLPHVRGGS